MARQLLRMAMMYGVPEVLRKLFVASAASPVEAQESDSSTTVSISVGFSSGQG